MTRALATAIFALAAGSAVLASAGVAVPAHRMPAGTAADHSMPLAAYRLSFLIEPAMPTGPQLTPAMAALHRAFAQAGVPIAMEMPQVAAELATGPLFRTSLLDPPQDLGLALALLVTLVPRLPRPTRRLLAVLAPPAIAIAQWWSAVPLAPPRLASPPVTSS